MYIVYCIYALLTKLRWQKKIHFPKLSILRDFGFEFNSRISFLARKGEASGHHGRTLAFVILGK